MQLSSADSSTVRPALRKTEIHISFMELFSFHVFHSHGDHKPVPECLYICDRKPRHYLKQKYPYVKQLKCDFAFWHSFHSIAFMPDFIPVTVFSVEAVVVMIAMPTNAIVRRRRYRTNWHDICVP